MVSLFLFLALIFLLIEAVRNVSFQVVLALILAAVAWYYHRKWDKEAHPEDKKKGFYL